MNGALGNERRQARLASPSLDSAILYEMQSMCIEIVRLRQSCATLFARVVCTLRLSSLLAVAYPTDEYNSALSADFGLLPFFAR